MEGEEEEDDEDDAENGQDEDPHGQIHRLKRSLGVVRAVWDGGGLLQ